jgi:hypothetical protein
LEFDQFQNVAIMAKKIKPHQAPEIPGPGEPPEIKTPVDPEEPLASEIDPDISPEPDTDETPPYEIPAPGEGP